MAIGIALLPQDLQLDPSLIIVQNCGTHSCARSREDLTAASALRTTIFAHSYGPAHYPVLVFCAVVRGDQKSTIKSIFYEEF